MHYTSIYVYNGDYCAKQLLKMLQQSRVNFLQITYGFTNNSYRCNHLPLLTFLHDKNTRPIVLLERAK